MDLKKGDRVTVKVHEDPSWNGVITGEARDGHAWQIVKDGTKFARGIHKDFCQPEKEKPGL
jgi:hypothetical protein